MHLYTAGCAYLLEQSLKMANLSKRDYRALIYEKFLENKTAVVAHAELCEHFPDAPPSYPTVTKWFRRFTTGHLDLDDDARIGRPKSVTTAKNIDAVDAMIKTDPHVTVKEIAESVKISEGVVWTIIREHLRVRKLCQRWVPHLLTKDQMKTRVKLARKILEKLSEDSKYEVYTEDESWFSYYDPLTKQQN
ncbi:histone-lysine N-methyltransferase SETMAR-like [Paramacrobiotus metropolitanus]|uniref:histone-lysine N-methyltransferase SETMAR-like n=1 Tax=Paramacrobiotus metropolitanus TaxID=2943436 RepID=UPI0024461AB0|nr:histone-lysine N-methyltransferase SETMAR-like [Paramacrobiotus metropolitanus]